MKDQFDDKSNGNNKDYAKNSPMMFKMMITIIIAMEIDGKN